MTLLLRTVAVHLEKALDLKVIRTSRGKCVLACDVFPCISGESDGIGEWPYCLQQVN